MDYNEISRKTEELEILFKCREHKAEVLDLIGVYGTEATLHDVLNQLNYQMDKYENLVLGVGRRYPDAKSDIALNLTPESVKNIVETLQEAYPKARTERANLIVDNKLVIPYIKIGKQTWMKYNLSIDDGEEGINWNPDNGEVYYTWSAACRVADKIDGWHLPSREEWDELCDFLKGNRDWDDEDDWHNYTEMNLMHSPFRAEPSGYYYREFKGQNESGEFWSSEEHGGTCAMKRHFNVDNPDRLSEVVEGHGAGLSVRLIRDRL
jgi:uncharacterized protein (TIGR02145 family)